MKLAGKRLLDPMREQANGAGRCQSNVFSLIWKTLKTKIFLVLMLMDIKRTNGVNTFYEVLSDSSQLISAWLKTRGGGKDQTALALVTIRKRLRRTLSLSVGFPIPQSQIRSSDKSRSVGRANSCSR